MQRLLRNELWDVFHSHHTPRKGCQHGVPPFSLNSCTTHHCQSLQPCKPHYVWHQLITNWGTLCGSKNGMCNDLSSKDMDTNDAHGHSWTPMDIHGHSWTSMDLYGPPWTSMDTHRNQSNSTKVGWIPWNSVKFHRGQLIIPWGVHKSWVTVVQYWEEPVSLDQLQSVEIQVHASY